MRGFEKSAQLAGTTANSFDLQNALQARDGTVLRAKADDIRLALGADAAAVSIVDVTGDGRGRYRRRFTT